MKKEFTIKIYTKKAGARYENFIREIYSGSDKKAAFKEGRDELVRIANCDLARGLSEASEAEILQEIKEIEAGSFRYYFDQTTYFFKVYSKKAKQPTRGDHHRRKFNKKTVSPISY